MGMFKIINKVTGKECNEYHQESFASFYAFLINNAHRDKKGILGEIGKLGKNGIQWFKIIDMKSGKEMFNGKNEPAKGGFITDENSIPLLGGVDNYGNLNKKKEIEKLFKETKEIKVIDLVEKSKAKRKYKKKNA